MDFTLTDEQEMLRDTARTLLGKECPPGLVRAYIDDPRAADDLWVRHLRDWVVLGDGPLVDHCLFVEEAGAVLLPGPYLATSALFVPLLRAIEHPLADRAASGEVTGTVSMAGRSGLWTANDEPVHTFVLDADRVDHIAVVGAGPTLSVVASDSVKLERISTLDATRRAFTLEVPSGVERAEVDPAVVDGVIERAIVALSAELVGVSRWLLDHSTSYAKERVQFDKPIGSFQGLQWKLVAMAQDHERAAAAVAYAAMTIDADDPDRHRATHVAKAAAGRAARHAAKDGLQVHGGIGYTWEHDLHLYMRRAVASDALLGPSAWHQDRLGELLFE
jgi:alkylation response protein AidB-like acyl-CoA dehydrogenase